MNAQSYCVVGGGISGLTAAYRLRAATADATITLFDPGDRLGGVLRTELVAGRPTDLGAEAFLLRRPEMPALLAELGLSGRQLATTGARPLIYSQQQLHPLPSGTVVGIPSSATSLADWGASQPYVQNGTAPGCGVGCSVLAGGTVDGPGNVGTYFDRVIYNGPVGGPLTGVIDTSGVPVVSGAIVPSATNRPAKLEPAPPPAGARTGALPPPPPP